MTASRGAKEPRRRGRSASAGDRQRRRRAPPTGGIENWPDGHGILLPIAQQTEPAVLPALAHPASSITLGNHALALPGRSARCAARQPDARRSSGGVSVGACSGGADVEAAERRCRSLVEASVSVSAPAARSSRRPLRERMRSSHTNSSGAYTLHPKFVPYDSPVGVDRDARFSTVAALSPTRGGAGPFMRARRPSADKGELRSVAADRCSRGCVIGIPYWPAPPRTRVRCALAQVTQCPRGVSSCATEPGSDVAY